MRISIDMRGVQEAFRRAPQVFMTEMARGAKEGLTDIQRNARLQHDYDSKSGNLSRSIKVDFNNWQGRGIYLDSGIAPYGRWVHGGTRPHRIYPRNKQALSFVLKNGKHVLVPKNMGYVQTRQYWREQARLSGAGLGYKGYVDHPGTSPDEFIYEAAKRGTPNLINKINKGVGRAIVKLGMKGKL